MATVDYIQTSFAGGEIGSSLYGRTDIAQYAAACQIVENMLVRPYGSAISTPGTRYVATASSSTVKIRLIPFVFNRDDATIIEMSPGLFRFYTNRGIILTGSTIYTVAHTYTEDQLFDIQFAQLNDIIWLTHKDHPPRRLVRYGATDWELEDFAFIGGPFLDDNTSDITITASATAGTVNLTLSATSSTIYFTPSTSATVLGSVNSYWKIGGTRTSSTTGIEVQGYVKIATVTSPSTGTATVMKTLTTSAATKDFAEGAWSSAVGWPARVVFHEQRLFFARTDYEPQKIWGSKSFVYDDFALDGQVDDDAINIQLASNEANAIQWLASGTDLIAGTYGGEFTISGGDNPITPDNVKAKKQSTWGSEDIVPKRVGNFFYYIQRFGRKLRELFYFWDLDSYKAVDKTILHPQVLGDGVIDMAYQQVPDTILYCVLTNGTISTLTREVDQEVQAWSRQTTDGTYGSIAVIPSKTQPYDEVWVVVQRNVTDTVGTTVTRKFIEVFENIEIPDRQDDCFYVHSGLDYSSYEQTTGSTLTLSATNGTIIFSITATTATTAFTSADIGRRIRAINADGDTLGEAEITTLSQSTIVIGTASTSFSTTSFSGTRWGKSIVSLSGMDHLEGKTVVVLADGGTDKPNKTVSLGTISLAYNYFKVKVGLPYTQTLYTLPIETGTNKGTAQGKKQKINEIAFKVNKSHKGFKTGGSEEFVERINWRDPSTLMGTPETLYTGIMSNITFRDDVNYGSRVMIVNDDPLPVEILNIIPTITTYEK